MESGNSGTSSAQDLPPLLERFPHQIPPAKRQQVKGVKVQLGAGAAGVLQHIERRPSAKKEQNPEGAPLRAPDKRSTDF
jgi:hypothetical protein